MTEPSQERRFKTAGARILRTRKLPKDFFANSHPKLRFSDSVHASQDKSPSKAPPDIFQFTFMRINSSRPSLRKTKSNLSLPTRQPLLPSLVKATWQKENRSPDFLVEQSNSRQFKQGGSSDCLFKRRLQRVSLAQLHKL